MNAETGGGLSVRKIATRTTMSTEQALMYGLITEEQAREMGWTPPPPVSRYRRLRWALAWWWSEHRPHVHLGPCDHQEDE
jgi:hypothetical protein